MITPEEAVRLARLRRAKGGETWLPVPDAALYAFVPINTVYHWARQGRIRRLDGRVDLGEVLEVRDDSTVRVVDAPLTYRVLAYFRLAANGWTSQQVAEKYEISRYAVHTALNDAARALGARNRTHAVALLMGRGLISPDEVHVQSTAIMDKLQGERSA